MNSEVNWPYEAMELGGATIMDIQKNSVVCTLSAADMRERIVGLKADFIHRIVRVEEVKHGQIYWFDRTVENMNKVGEFAISESDCCNFLSFGIGLHPDGKQISLRISGPMNVPQFLREAIKGNVPTSEQNCCTANN